MIAYVLVALFGLALGSFLNVCIVRLPKGESIISPRSHCPRCGHPIRWHDNLPILSYLFLRGRCRDCKAGISAIYPLVESLTAAILIANFHQYGLSPEFIKWALFSLLLIVLVFTDLDARLIPRAVTLLGSGLGLVLSFLIPVDSRPLEWLLARRGIFPSPIASSVLGALLGALAGGGLLYAVGEVFYRIYRKQGLGFGDVMLMLMVGSFLGPPLTLMTVLLGSLFGCLMAVPLRLSSARFRDYQWPYGSFLGAAAIFVSLGGPALLAAYLRWAGLG